MKKISRYIKLVIVLISTMVLFACSNDNTSETESSAEAEIASAVMVESVSDLVSYDEDDYLTEWDENDATFIELDGSEIKAEGDVIISDGSITIKTSGTYVVSGELTDGQIIVDAEDKGTVHLVLNGVTITDANSAPIYVKEAQKTVLTIQEGTENVVTDGSEYVYDVEEDEEPNAAIFSKDNLTINGTGALSVQANFNNGITSKDELKIIEGNIDIVAADDGLIGRDLLAIKDGNFIIDAAGDGLKSSKEEDEDKGNIVIENGTFDVISGSDGIQAINSLYIVDGTYNFVSGEGSPDTIETGGAMERAWGGETSSTEEVTDETSTKGLKATVEIMVSGGTFTMNTLDDAIHSNGTITISAGDFTIATGDDGVHADSSLDILNGTITITKSYEGIESNTITIEDGEINIVASDDGVNVAGGDDATTVEGYSESEDNALIINGGFITVDAQGDGLDANGSIYMSAGTVIVNGPTNSGNGSLDYDGEFEITGGTLIASGSSGMVQATSESSTQNAIMMTYSETQVAGTTVHVEDDDGNTIITYTPSKDYQSVLISTEELETDTSYTLYTGGSSTGNETSGLITDGDDYQSGEEVVTFIPTDVIQWIDESGITTGNIGGMGMGGNRQGEIPEEGMRGRPEGDMEPGEMPEGGFNPNENREDPNTDTGL